MWPSLFVVFLYVVVCGVVGRNYPLMDFWAVPVLPIPLLIPTL